VKQFDRAQVQDWYEKHVKNAPRVLAIYGDVDVTQAKQLATNLLGKGSKPNKTLSRGPKGSAPATDAKPASPPQITVTRVEVNKTNNPQAGVVIGFESDSVVGAPYDPAMNLADCLTSGAGYPTGYIFEILRGRGLVYDANAMNFPGLTPKAPGAFIAYAGCDPKNVTECADVILESLARIQSHDADINTDWFNRSKQLIVTGDAINNETPAAQATQAALDELYGLGYDYHARFPDRINAVTLDDVRRLAASRLTKCVVTVSTPDPDQFKIKTGPRSYPSFPPVDLTPRGVQHDSGAAK